MMGKLLIAGGYGVVGRRMAALLAPMFPERIVIAGRRLDAAQAAASAIGFGARGRVLDVNDRESVRAALAGVDVVASCVDQREPHLVQVCARNGLAYTDITPHLAFRDDIEAIDTLARQSGARILFGAGIAPGIANVMAARLVRDMGTARAIDTTVLLSIGDEYGAGSSGFLTDTLIRPFRILEGGALRTVAPFTEPRRVRFSPPVGARLAYLFPSSDVVSYPTSLGVTTAVGRYALDPKWLGPLVSTLVRSGILRFLRGRLHRQNQLISSLKRFSGACDLFGVLVTVTGEMSQASMELTGHHQADATAASAAEFCRALYDGRVNRTGVSFSEQVIDPDDFFDRLRTYGFESRLTLESHPASM